MPKSSSRTLPLAVDEDIARLEIAVDNQVAMRVADGVADLQHQDQSSGERQAAGPAVPP